MKKTQNVNHEWIALGTFKLTQPMMRISDPGYDDKSLGDTIESLSGTWKASVLQMPDAIFGSGRRCARLMVQHESYDGDLSATLTSDSRNPPKEFEYGGYIGVDSGQAGFYDDALYGDDSSINPRNILPNVDDWDADDWYKANCSITLQGCYAGVIPHGAVSESGYGDGEYNYFIHYNTDGNVDAAILYFI